MLGHSSLRNFHSFVFTSGARSTIVLAWEVDASVVGVPEADVGRAEDLGKVDLEDVGQLVVGEDLLVGVGRGRWSGV